MANSNEEKARESTYTGFIGMVKWGIIGTALVAAFVIFMITK